MPEQKKEEKTEEKPASAPSSASTSAKATVDEKATDGKQLAAQQGQTQQTQSSGSSKTPWLICGGCGCGCIAVIIVLWLGFSVFKWFGPGMASFSDFTRGATSSIQTPAP